MIFPYNTDAPLYHPPFATGGVMLLNLLIFLGVFAQPAFPENIEPWVLWYGQGLRPWQWLTSNFLHANLMHMAGNVLALWGLGLIVEGKLGWWKFVLLYLGIGVASAGIEQVLMLGMSEGASLGASSINFGLLAICLIWAPRNEFQCVFWWGRGTVLFDVSVLVYAFLLLALEAGIIVFTGFSVSSALLHLLGAGVGAVVGVALLKLDQVDCEGWDLFSVWSGQPGAKRAAGAQQKNGAEADDSRRQSAIEQIHQLIDEGKVELAIAAERRMSKEWPDWRLPAEDLLKLITAAQQNQRWSDAVGLMVEYLQNYEPKRGIVRLQLAKVLIEHLGRPAQALHVLEKIDDSELSERHQHAHQQLRAAAEKLQVESEIEMQSEDW